MPRRCRLHVTAYTPCFRREAGSHGKDTRGLIRVHQFDKVELVRLCPARGQRAGARADHGAGRDGAAAARTAVSGARPRGWRHRLCQRPHLRPRSLGRRRRRAGSRCRAPAPSPTSRRAAPTSGTGPAPGAKPEFVHTLNASGIAFPRTIIALLENGQQADGSVVLPAALVPYVGTDRLVPRA